jgi:hypothetical protein
MFFLGGDYLGEVHAAFCRTIQSHQDPVMAGAMDALIAAKFSRNLGLLNIELERDSLLVIKAIKESAFNGILMGK